MKDVPILETGEFFERAERAYILGHGDQNEFHFAIRKKAQIQNFYEKLDRFLQEQSTFSVSEYRMVKEGFVRVSRPALLSLSLTALLKKKPYLRHLKERFELLKNSTGIFSVSDFAEKNHSLFFEDIEVTTQSLEILQFMIQHRFEMFGLLPREVPHGVSTKLIGKKIILLKLFEFWRKMPQNWKDFYDYFGLSDRPCEFRFFTQSLSIQNQKIANFHGILARPWIEDYKFQDAQGTLILENSQSFFSCTTKNGPNNFVLIEGGGWKAVRLLPLFRFLPEPHYYWGDMDKEGYEIFGFLKRASPKLKHFMMDQEVLELHRHLWQKKAPYLGPLQNVPELQNAYEFVCRQGLQIEQEQLPLSFPVMGLR